MINKSFDNTYDTAWSKIYKTIVDETKIYEAQCTNKQQIR